MCAQRYRRQHVREDGRHQQGQHPAAVLDFHPRDQPVLHHGREHRAVGSSSDAFRRQSRRLLGQRLGLHSHQRNHVLVDSHARADGRHEPHGDVRATDQAGNSATAVTTIIAIATNPNGGDHDNGGTNFATSATPLAPERHRGGQLRRLVRDLSNNGGASSTATGTTGWSASIPCRPAPTTSSGPAFDARRNAASSITVTLDQTNPTISFLTPDHGHDLFHAPPAP